MRVIMVAVALAAVSVVGVADETNKFAGPYLTRSIGDDRDTAFTKCEVFSTEVRIQHTVGKVEIKERRTINLKKEIPKLFEMVTAAAKAGIDTLTYIKEQRPNESIYAFGEKGEKVMLFADGGNKQTRKGDEAKDLRLNTHELCGQVSLPAGIGGAMVTVPGKLAADKKDKD